MFFPATLKGRYIEQMTDVEFFAFCQDNRDFKFERTPEGQLTLMSPRINTFAFFIFLIPVCQWMDNGCLLGWLIDPDEEVVYVYHQNKETIHKGFDSPISGEPVLQNFESVLSELRM